jgi:hypothetical protein
MFLSPGEVSPAIKVQHSERSELLIPRPERSVRTGKKFPLGTVTQGDCDLDKVGGHAGRAALSGGGVGGFDHLVTFEGLPEGGGVRHGMGDD